MNSITQSFLNPLNFTPMGAVANSVLQSPVGQGASNEIGNLLRDLAQLVDGKQGGTGEANPLMKDLASLFGTQNGPTLPTNPQMTSGIPSGNGQGSAGQGLHNIKINSKAGGDALHLQEDSQGNLYNASGNNVGHIGKDGSVTLNSGATKEAAILETGSTNGKASLKQVFNGAFAKSSKGDGGNQIFDSSQVTVSAGDLNQKNDI
ncbi:hypothetical protein [Burkholderia metallica]|uniref:hypothetical protein n=1 Tax=Burkholderia metallica TaxID=488729 RepID=UPI001CF59021|nr:hypothetical protein [Burkholderia metallica]MCA8003495.1 hypothetical protein [Burkholderia metallica]